MNENDNPQFDLESNIHAIVCSINVLKENDINTKKLEEAIDEIILDLE